MTLRVGFDASASAVAQPTGVGLAVLHLARALQASPDVQVEVLYRLSRLKRRRFFLAGGRAFHERFSVLLGRRLDVFHGPDSRLARIGAAAQVATVHDLSARHGFSSVRFRATREAHWADAAARANLIVTYTEAIKAEVVSGLDVPAERVAVVPLAPTDALAAPPTDEARSTTERVVGQRPFVLCLGELSARKNTVGALEAFAAAAELGDVALVLVGPDGHGHEAVSSAIQRLGLGERVVRPSYLPPQEVACLLSRASALLFPSRYEGFGMPVLEAFRAQVPVVASTAPSVVEVAGGAALHADGDDAVGLAAELTRAVRDSELRADLVRRGLARLQAFSWERSAEGLLAVYRAAHEGAPAPVCEATCSP